MEYRLVVDSAGELIPELIEAMDAKSVPLTMTLGDDSYVDDAHLDVDNFLKKMNAYKGRAMSSCPSPQAYCNEFAKDKMNLVVTISSQLSGSYSSALIGKNLAEEEGTQVHVFDSKSATAGQLLISLKIKELVESGMEKNHIIETVEEFIKNMKTLFVLENLDNLMKNGRMNKIVVKIATVMQIRPILGADGEGNIAFFSKAKGTRAAIEKLCETIGDQCTDTKNRILAITHCNNEEQAMRLKKMAEDKYSFKDIVIAKTRGLASMYANEGGVVIAF